MKRLQRAAAIAMVGIVGILIVAGCAAGATGDGLEPAAQL